MKWWCFLGLGLLFNFTTLGTPHGLLPSSDFCSSPQLETMPIRQNGRVKPLFVHAQEALKYLTGSRQSDPTTTYCLLSFQALQVPLQVQVEHVEAQKWFALPPHQKTIPYPELLQKVEDIRRYRATLPEGGLKKSLQKLLSQGGLYQDIIFGGNWFLPQISSSEVAWIPLRNLLEEENIPLLFQKATENFEKEKGRKHLLEYRLVRANLPAIALGLTLLSLAFLTLFSNFTVALFPIGATLLVQIALVTVRVVISGRAPITNMYETVLFSGLGALGLSLIIGHIQREKIFVYSGLAYNACTLMMMNFATGMLNDSISPLVPVLRDNFWLSTHVTTVIMSYGALALAWMLANTVLIRKRLRRCSPREEAHYASLIYTCLKYGTIMLGAGVILGGVWADYSWGRFWGWDPKETWSLIAFCLYMAILHGRYTQWISSHRFIVFSAAAFLSIVMAWFGVNYILASGLHSYGFSEGGAIFLGSFFIAQIALLIVTGPQGLSPARS